MYTKTCIEIRHRTHEYTNTSEYIQFKCFYLPETLKNVSNSNANDTLNYLLYLKL